jgi:hypothetical protein
MSGFDLGEELPGRPDLTSFRVLKTSSDAFLSVATGDNIKQPLMCLGILLSRIECRLVLRC